MDPSTLASLRRGVEAALVASVPQVLVPQLEQRALGLPMGSADIGHRFIQRLGEMADRDLPEDVRWLAASAFHFGYAAFWGALYALAYERRPTKPIVGGLLLSGLIYGITFTRWGGATLTRTAPPPKRRNWKKRLLLLTPPLLFGMGTAPLYGRGPHRSECQLAAEILEHLGRSTEPRAA